MGRNKRKQDRAQQESGYKKAKRENGEGSWALPVTKENTKFIEYYKGLGIVPEAEFEQFLETLKQPLPVTFRITGNTLFAVETKRMLETEFLHKKEVKLADGTVIPPPKPIEWYPNNGAWYFKASRKDFRRNPDLDSFHKFIVSQSEFGNISRQEAVSMIPVCFLQVEPNHRIIDMCAAPGSKSGQIIELLHAKEDKQVPTGVVVANDADLGRCYTLTHQIQRLSSHCCIVTNHEAQAFPYVKIFPKPGEEILEGTNRAGKIDFQFDRVLCDVPCSGDGTFRKNVDLWKKWTVASALGLHVLQTKITVRGAQLLKIGGRLVYSTCSLNPVEDEAVVAQVLRYFKGCLRLVDCSNELPLLKRSAGISTWKIQDTDGTWYSSTKDIDKPNRAAKLDTSFFPPTEEEAKEFGLHKCMRVLPHAQDTGGFFIAVFEKISSTWKEAQDKKGEQEVPKEEEEKIEIPADAIVKDDEVVIPEDGEEKDEEKESKTEEDDSSMNTDDTENPLIMKKPGTRTEEPFLPLPKEMIPTFESIKNFFGLSDQFPMDQLFVRSEKSNSIYFVSTNVRDMMLNDDGKKLRVVNTGVKMWTKHDSKDLVYDCAYRLSQEGIPPLLPYLSKRKVTIAEEDFKTLLTRKDPFIKWFTPAARDAINIVPSGSLIFVIEATTKKEWSGFACAGWRGKVSCHLNLPKEELNALRHLFGIPVENKKRGGEGRERKPKDINNNNGKAEQKSESKEEVKPVEEEKQVEQKIAILPDFN